jgi:hypothetical protein
MANPGDGPESGVVVDVEELWAEMVAFVMGVAQHHRTKVIVRGVGNDGRTLLIQVAGTVIGTLIVYWLIHR